MSPLFCHLTCLGWYLGYLRGIRVFYSAQHSLQICYTPPTINYASVGLPILMYLWGFSRETELVGIIWSNINLYMKRERRRKGHGGTERWEISGNWLTWLWSLLSPECRMSRLETQERGQVTTWVWTWSAGRIPSFSDTSVFFISRSSTDRKRPTLLWW